MPCCAPCGAAVVLLLASLCMWRRVYLFRRHGSEEQRSGMGLLRSTMSRQPPPRNPGSQWEAE